MAHTAAQDAISRLMQALSVDTRTALAAALNIPRTSINGAIERNEIPEAWLYKVAYKTGYSVDWLRSGKASDAQRIQTDTEGRTGGFGQAVLLREPRVKAILEKLGSLSMEGKSAVLQCAEAISKLEKRQKRERRNQRTSGL